ncbi:MAG: MATE family efflux transporter [Peptococcaceae bacterium]|nr:MATE family efflux transporter [Peptococcaceae bacterium]
MENSTQTENRKERKLSAPAAVNLTEGTPWKQLIWFTLPMLIGNVFQQLYNMADSIIVGNYVGKDALGAVGIGFPIIFLTVAFFMGLTMGASVLISQFFGAGDQRNLKKTIDTTCVTLFVTALIMTVVGLCTSRFMLEMMQTPDTLLPQAKTYLDIIFIGMIASAGYNTVSAILRGLGDTKTPLYFLIIATVINIILDLVFILLFDMGVAGAAWATIIAQLFSFIISVIYVNKYYKTIHFGLKGMEFDGQILKSIFMIGLPAGIQQMVVSVGFIVLQSMINSFGEDVISGFNAASKLDSFAIMPIMNFGMAISTFVAQNVGARKTERVKEGSNAAILTCVVLSIIISAGLWLFCEPLLKLFNKDPGVIAAGADYIYRVVPFYFLLGLTFIYSGIMRGYGAALIPMLISVFTQIIIRLPSAYYLIRMLDSANGIWWSFPVSWILGFILCYGYYKFGGWRKSAPVGKHQNQPAPDIE